MPLYDYTCPLCRHSFTARQGFHDLPGAACPRCGGAGRRRLSIPSIVYKGSGFYSTDSGRRSGSEPGDKSLASAPPGGSEDGTGAGHGDASTEKAATHPHPHPHLD